MAAVSLAPVLEAEDQDHELVILDLMQDAPVTGPDRLVPGSPTSCVACPGPRILGEET